MRLKIRPTPLTDDLHKAQTRDDPRLCEEYYQMLDHARQMERERDYMIINNNKLRGDFNAVAGEACQLQDALGFPCETENAQEKAMERLRDLIAAEGWAGDLEEECKRLHGLWHEAEVKANHAKASKAERSALGLLAGAWNEFNEMQPTENEDKAEFRQSINRAAGVIAVRIAGRVDPDLWTPSLIPTP